MEIENPSGIFCFILGLIFILFPMFSSGLISIIVGLSLLFFGISAILMGYNMRNYRNRFSTAVMIIGIISVILGIAFIFFINAISFIVAFQFYIVGFIMIAFGITGLLSKMNRISLFTSVLVLLMGIVVIALAVFALNQPIYISIIIGIVLIIEGLNFLLDD